MEAISVNEDPYDREDSWSEDRASDAGPINLCIRLWSLARDLHEEGDLPGAREAALDATVVWALEPWSVDEEVLIELLLDVCGLDAYAILESARTSRSLSAWQLGRGPLPSRTRDGRDGAR